MQGPRLLARFWRAQSGNYVTMFALATPFIVGGAGLASEGGMWLYQHNDVQAAADSAALSAANARTAYKSTNMTNQANSVTTSYGYSNGVSGTTVVVNSPPTSGPRTGNADAVEVIVTIQQPRLLTKIFFSNNVTIRGRSVALNGANGVGCVLALNKTVGNAVNINGNPALTLKGCSIYSNSNSSSSVAAGGTSTASAVAVYAVGKVSGSDHFTTTDGITPNSSPTSDPYASAQIPSYSGCDYNNKSYKTTVTISPGVYCNGISLNAGANVTMQPGTYIIDRGDLSVNGGATLTGTGVTIILTSSTGKNYPNVTINGGATVSLTAPTSGDTSGLVFFADRNTPTSNTFKFNGGSGQVIGGAIYIPTGSVQYAGGATSGTDCTQVIGDTVDFVGNSVLAVDCGSKGTKSIGNYAAKLVE
jgi:Flp pilus assembly protein TadG